MNFYDYNNVNVENVNFETVTIYNINGFNRDFNLNEVSEHSDFSDTKVVQPYFDFESSMNIEDMMTALDKDIIFSNDEPIPENDNSFDNSYEKFEMIVDNIRKKPIENTGKFINQKLEKKKNLHFSNSFFSLYSL